MPTRAASKSGNMRPSPQHNAKILRLAPSNGASNGAVEVDDQKIAHLRRPVGLVKRCALLLARIMVLSTSLSRNGGVLQLWPPNEQVQLGLHLKGCREGKLVIAGGACVAGAKRG